MGNKLHTRTTFVETEVLPHTKLNTMDSQTENGLEMMSGVLAAFGGDDRVVDDKDISTELYVTDSAVPDMNVNVATGFAVVSEITVRNESVAVLTIVAPVTSNRFDAIQISNEGVLSTKSSAEQAVPVEPSADADNIKLAAIYLPQNAPKIDQTDLGDGYLIDRRTFSLHPTTVKRHIHRFIPGTLAIDMGPVSDGYVDGTSAGVGFAFNEAVTVETVTTSMQDVPTGADVTFIVHNKTAGSTDSITHSDGVAHDTDATIDLDFAISDIFALEVTQVGSTAAGGWVNLDFQYVLQ